MPEFLAVLPVKDDNPLNKIRYMKKSGETIAGYS